jgi:SAM-dependent methyltransferase
MRQFLGEEVYHADPEKLPFDTNSFDIVVSIDVLEHLKQDHPFLKEVHRILKSNGEFLVTVPNGDPRLLANRIRHWVGMRPEKYGHTRAGYTLRELDLVTTEVGFQTLDRDGYSRFFTEMIELLINYFYVFKLSKKGKTIKEGHIAPTTAGELQTHGTAYRLYSFFFPVLLGISKLDVFLSKKTNNAVIIKARKPLLQEVAT